MQQQQQHGGPAQFSASPPDISTFASPVLDHHRPQQLAEAASPISSRPPQPPQRQNFDELLPVAAAGGHLADEEMEIERGGTPGNRWPRQETLALLKIRSEMDAAFRDASLKGPLWDDVSRKLGELGYTRSAKKCKEKFENVHKYYKRTKEGRAGRQDGKTYRFFTQLEALHTGTGAGAGAGVVTTTTPSLTTAMPHPITSIPAAAMIHPAKGSPAPSPTTPIGTSSSMPSLARAIQPPPATVLAPFPIARPPAAAPPVMSTIATPVAAAAGISFSSDTFTTSSSESDGEETEEGGEGRKRKRDEGAGPGGSSGGNRKMMAFFEGLMKQVMERQEAMQQRFLETIEKREQDRMIREEAWKCQEMARLNREHEFLAQERAMAASRDAAVISFLQKISGQTLQLSSVTAAIPSPPPPVATQQQQPQPPPPQQHQQTNPPAPPSPKPPHDLHLHHQSTEIVVPNQLPSSSSTELVPVPESHEVVPGSGPSYEGVSSSRWPKPEVHALIKIRSGLEEKYQEAGPKGPLWEEISAEMHRLGYNRSSKRCKEKWENINKYFKKVKESNKKRPEDAKTCPYFHQLDALYRKKLLSRGGTSSGLVHGSPAPNPTPSELLMSMALPQAPPPPQHHHQETESKNVSNDNGIGRGSGGIQIQTNNGGLPASFFKELGTSGGDNNAMKKPEGTVMETPAHQQAAAAAMDDYDSENMDDDDEDDDDDEEDMKMQYKIQYQRQNASDGTGGNASANKSPAPGNPGSFLAMVQ